MTTLHTAITVIQAALTPRLNPDQSRNLGALRLACEVQAALLEAGMLTTPDPYTVTVTRTWNEATDRPLYEALKKEEHDARRRTVATALQTYEATLAPRWEKAWSREDYVAAAEVVLSALEVS